MTSPKEFLKRHQDQLYSRRRGGYQLPDEVWAIIRAAYKLPPGERPQMLTLARVLQQEFSLPVGIKTIADHIRTHLRGQNGDKKTP